MNKSEERYNTAKAVTEYYQMQYAQFLPEQFPALTEPFYMHVNQLLVTHCPQGAQVLEVGCGLGRVLFDLSVSRPDIAQGVGTDISQAFITECLAIREGKSSVLSHFPPQPAYSKLNFMVGDAQALSLSDASFDMVICLNVIDRVPEPLRVLSEIARVLKPGGILLFTDPYDWSTSYTPLENQIKNVADVYSELQWEYLENQDVPFILYRNPRESIHYNNHLIVARKK